MSDEIIFTPEFTKRADQICANYPVKRAAVLPVMRLIQEEHGAISPDAELEIADYFRIPPADVKELMTFYTLFYSKPKGRCHIQICRTLSCSLRGAGDLIQYLEDKLGIRSGETTEDGQFSLDQVECLGACEIAPMAKINQDYIGPLTKEKLAQFLAKYYIGKTE
ncbi:MAG: NAD(P)H-dependent oxidoreductase subunit E [Candidatus Omnitrophica bacterium]|nr:NAD(P)H-dependent oxidoreductase subunit E [Candidatus Omnitrophota bacterium]